MLFKYERYEKKTYCVDFFASPSQNEPRVVKIVTKLLLLFTLCYTTTFRIGTHINKSRTAFIESFEKGKNKNACSIFWQVRKRSVKKKETNKWKKRKKDARRGKNQERKCQRIHLLK